MPASAREIAHARERAAADDPDTPPGRGMGRGLERTPTDGGPPRARTEACPETESSAGASPASSGIPRARVRTPLGGRAAPGRQVTKRSSCAATAQAATPLRRLRSSSGPSPDGAELPPLLAGVIAIGGCGAGVEGASFLVGATTLLAARIAEPTGCGAGVFNGAAVWPALCVAELPPCATTLVGDTTMLPAA